MNKKQIIQELTKLEKRLSGGDFGQILEILQDLTKSIILFDSIELTQRSETIYYKAMNGINENQEKIDELLNSAENFKLERDFSSARNAINKVRVLYNRITNKSDLNKVTKIDLGALQQEIKSSEHEFNVYNALLGVIEKHARVHLLEITNESKVNLKEAEEIVKKLIAEGKIKAYFDETSKGIEFKFAVDEIDELLRVYRDWEKVGKGKKR